jgi:hypothetical protein
MPASPNGSEHDEQRRTDDWIVGNQCFAGLEHVEQRGMQRIG